MTFSKKYKKGFSLIELLVVMAIFVIMTTIIIARQNKYSSDSEITNLAYKMALAIRQAQVYGLSVKGDINNDPSTPNFNVGYGIHFDSSQPINQSFILFADQGNPRNYVHDTDEPALTTYSLDKGITITNFCVDDGRGGGKMCKSDSPSAANLDIVFTRPDPKASIIFYSGDVSNLGNSSADYDQIQKGRAAISIQSPLQDKKTKCIIVTNAGQISVADPVNKITNDCI